MRLSLLLTIVSTLLILNSCDKGPFQELDYDCSLERTTTYEDGSEDYWNLYYYKDELLVRHESSYLKTWVNYEYDGNGNLIETSSNSGHIINTYNYFDKLTKSIHFTYSDVDYSEIYNYTDTLQTSHFQINASGDTINWTYSYYNTQGILDSAISRHGISYYYYSSEIDSVYSYRNDGSLSDKRYSKYENGNKIYQEGILYMEGSEFGHSIYTWDYNEFSLITRRKEDIWDINGGKRWRDTEYTYNENLNLSGTKERDENGEIISYSIFTYNNTFLTLIEVFLNDGTLFSTTIVDDSCGFIY